MKPLVFLLCAALLLALLPSVCCAASVSGSESDGSGFEEAPSAPYEDDGYYYIPWAIIIVFTLVGLGVLIALVWLALPVLRGTSDDQQDK